MDSENRERLRSKIFAAKIQVANLEELLRVDASEPEIYRKVLMAHLELEDAMRLTEPTTP